MDWLEENKMRLQELPEEIRSQALCFLGKFVTTEQKKFFREKIAENPETWWVGGGWHFGGGMFIRNKLRDEVCLDDQLPSRNWDDYYIPLLEEAIKSNLYDDWEQW